MSEFISINSITLCVAEVFGVAPIELRSARKQSEVVAAKHAAFLLARELTAFSLPTIASQMGGRDHTTVLHGIETAKNNCQNDETYALKIDAARMAVLALAQMALQDQLADPDALACAERVCRNPPHEALLVSTREIVAMAVRLLELEDAAAMTVGLLEKLDELADLRSVLSMANRVHRRRLAREVNVLTETLSTTLSSLGYSQENSNVEAAKEKAAGHEPARAANAG